MLRKVNDKIFLDVYRLNGMRLLDECFKQSIPLMSYNESNEIFKTNVEQPFGMSFVKVDSDGEAYVVIRKHPCHITKDNRDLYNYEYMFDIDENYIKLMMSFYLMKLKSFKVNELDFAADSGMDIHPNATYKNIDIQRKIKNVKTILNWWDEKDDDNTSEVIGARLDPFAVTAFHKIWLQYDYVIHNSTRTDDFSYFSDDMRKFIGDD